MNTSSPDKQPLVSIIIPVYNSESFLKETIDSVLASTYKPIEIIIIDDGSTDGSATIAQSYADAYSHVHFYQQENKGVAAARNNGIDKSHGEYILPVDSDDLISPDYIAEAVAVFASSPSVKVISTEAEYFGMRSGPWKLAPFSLPLIARRNMISCCSLFRKEDWKRVGGFYEHTGREDWIFWISVLKDGGDAVRLQNIGHYYRIHDQSKRKRDRSKKKEIVDTLNHLYPDFFQKTLSGPLRYNRSLSRIINRIQNFIHVKKFHIDPQYNLLGKFLISLPSEFEQSGTTIHKGRNELKKYQVDKLNLIVKSYKRPLFINRIIYGWFRKSKAERAYLNAKTLLDNHIGTPPPVGYMTVGKNFLFDKSFFVSVESTCPYIYNDLNKQHFTRRNEILEAIAHTTAALHEKGFLHKDYSGGNILFDDSNEKIHVEIIDLNRMHFSKIDVKTGCKNFERLTASEEMLEIIGKAYAKARGFDEAQCISLIKEHNLSLKDSI